VFFVKSLCPKTMMPSKVMRRGALLLLSLLVLSACFKAEFEPRHLTTEEYILLNQKQPLWLVNIDLSGADLRGVDLSHADLASANLSSADLSGANLSGSNLTYADLRNADLGGADLGSADLRGTNLSGATMDGVNLKEAEYDSVTRWRAGFNPSAAGAKMMQ
jgi:hypothetical protein